MPKEKDPASVVEVIRESIQVSKRQSRRIRAHRFKELFGYQALSAQRREHLERLLADAGIDVTPSLAEAKRDDWLVLSMPEPPVVSEGQPDPRPSVAWFQHLQTVKPASEREVEIQFAGTLFRGLGYEEEQEAAGFGIQIFQGVHRQRVEADLIYFADYVHDLQKGQPLVLVECKRPGKQLDIKAAAAQARSYALWVLPAYYVVTNAEIVSVWDYQGAIAPDREVMRFTQPALEMNFDQLYAYLNPAAAAETRRTKIARLPETK